MHRYSPEEVTAKMRDFANRNWETGESTTNRRERGLWVFRGASEGRIVAQSTNNVTYDHIRHLIGVMVQDRTNTVHINCAKTLPTCNKI